MPNRSGAGGYGLLGDTRTAALVSPEGSVEWMCLPHFDGDPVFARLVAGPDGGHFSIRPVEPARLVGRRYRPGTTVLETEWEVGASRAVLVEGMIAEVVGTLLPTTCLVRRVEVTGAPVRVEVSFEPRCGPQRRALRSRPSRPQVTSAPGGVALAVASEPELDIRPGRPVEVEVAPGRPLTVALSAAHRGPLSLVSAPRAWEALLEDAEGWRRWSATISYDGPAPAAVVRSLITLRLLTYSPSGAPVAAPTTSLPEHPGGGRNWDYRYSWVRDASVGVGAFLGVGLLDEARAFLYWLLHASRLDRPRLPVVLSIHGCPVPAERDLDGWPGFAASAPVRIGNGARDQHQLDGYGWVLDAMWLAVQAGHHLFSETWRTGAALADEVARRWREPDAGIWEVRGDLAHYVHSKLMGWLTLDRALAIAEVQGASTARRERWRKERDALRADIAAQGYDEERRSYVRAYGRQDLDSAVLLLPVIGFDAGRPERVRSTIAAIRHDLSAGGALMYRYPPGEDGLAGGEGAFLPCSFWLVQALAATGEVAEATDLFEQLVAMGGEMGLLSEEAHPATGEMLGNHPQALTHAALVQAGLAIASAQEDPSNQASATP